MKQDEMISRHPGKKLTPSRFDLKFVLLKALAACKIMGFGCARGCRVFE